MAADVGQSFSESLGISGSPTSTTGSVTTSASSSSFIIFANIFFGVLAAANDNKSNTYTRLGSIENTTDGNQLDVWLCTNGAGGAGHKPTVTGPFGTTATVGFIEITGAETSSVLDGVIQLIFDQASPFGADVTTANAHDLILGIFGSSIGPVTYTAGSGFTLVTAASGNEVGVAKRLVTSTGTYNPAFTLSSGSRGPAATIAFKDFGSGGAGATSKPNFLLLGVG
jgi:hypothetical protein